MRLTLLWSTEWDSARFTLSALCRMLTSPSIKRWVETGSWVWASCRMLMLTPWLGTVWTTSLI